MFTIEYNGITLGTGYYTITDPTGIFEIPIKTSQDDLTGGDGGNIWSQVFGMRDISIEGRIIANEEDVNTLIKNLSIAFSKTSVALPLIVTLSNGGSKSLNAKVIQMPQIGYKVGEERAPMYRILLKCEDPLYSSVESTTYTSGLSVGGGIAIPTPVAMSFSAGTGGSVIVTNNGDESADPEIILLGPLVNPVVRNATLQVQFQLLVSIVENETVTIKKTTQGITVESSLYGNYYPYFSGSLFKIAPEENTIIFSSSNTSSVALMTILVADKTKLPL